MKKLFTILILFLVSLCQAQTFISPSGSDATGDGTQAKPWKTLFKATSTATTGTIYLVAGTYTETQTSNLKPGVNIEGAGSATTIVKSNLTGQWSTFMQLENSSIGNGNQTISGITFDGQYVSESNKKTWIGIWVTMRNNVTIQNCVIKGFYNRGIIFNGNGRNESEIPVDPGIYTTGNKVINNQFINTAGKDAGGGTIYGQLNISGQKGILIEGNNMNQTQRVAGRNGQLIKYWGSGYNLGCKISNNILKRANFTGNSWNGDGDWNFAIELFNNSGLEISNNTIQGSIDLNYNRVVAPYAYSVWIHHNISDHSPINTREEQGIIFEFETTKAIVEDNKFYNMAMGITFNVRTPNNSGGYNNPKPVGGYSATTDIIIRNNLFAGLYSTPSSSAGIQFLTENETKDAYCRNLLIHNNTFVTNTSDPANAGIDLSHFTTGAASSNGITIRNNIFIGFAAQYLEGGSAKMTNTVSRDNCIWTNGNNNDPNWTGQLTVAGNLKVHPALDGNYLVPATSPIYGLGIGYQASAAPPPCNYVYSAWSECINGMQTRTVVQSPVGCTGTPGPLTQSCTILPDPCTYTYSAWGPCVNGVQSRTVVSTLPVGCSVTSSPILTQACTPPPPARSLAMVVTIYNPDGSVKKTIRYWSDNSVD